MAIERQNFNIGAMVDPYADLQRGLSGFSKALQENKDREIEATRLAREQERYDREKLLNQRVDADYSRQLGARKNIADITKEYMATPYAAKFGADQETAELDKRVMSMPASTWENITPEQAAALQEKYENVGQNKELARTKLMGTLMADGNVDYTTANAVAEDLTKGLMSRADKQAVLDKNLEVQQKAIENYNKLQADKNKDALEIYKTKANLQGDMYKAVGGAGGGTGGGGSIPKEFTAAATKSDLNEIITKGDLGTIDTKSALNLVDKSMTANYHPAVIAHALKNTTTIGGGITTDNKVNEEAFTAELAKYKTGTEGLTELTRELKNKPPYTVPTDPTLAQYVDGSTLTRQVYNPTPDAKGFMSKALTDERLAFLRTPEEQSKLEKAVEPVGQSAGGGTQEYQEKTKKVESGSTEGNYQAVNKGSGAIGAYQFLPSTLDDYRGKKGNPNFTNEEFVKNPELQDKVFKQFTQGNENILRNRGIEVNDYTRWLAHNLGAGNVKDFIEGNQTEKLSKAIGAQFGGKKTSIADYNERFAKEFIGTPTAKISKDGNRSLIDAFNKRAPTTTEDSIATRYDNIDSNVKETIERALPKNMELTDANKGKLVEAFGNLEGSYARTGSGPIDYMRYIQEFTKTSGVPKEKSKEIVDEYLRTLTVEAPAPDIRNELIRRQGGVSGSNPDADSEKLRALLNNTSQAERQQRIANKYMTDPASLTANEKRWIQDSRTTVNGRKLLKDLGID